MNIANGSYSGGGIRQNPSALPYDGFFDMIMVSKPNSWDIITALPLIFNGRITKHPSIKSFRTNLVDVNCSENTAVEADGIIVPNAHNCEVSILPQAIRMIVPESELSRR